MASKPEDHKNKVNLTYVYLARAPFCPRDADLTAATPLGQKSRMFVSQGPPRASQLTASQEDDTATAILKKKKKPNQLMYVQRRPGPSSSNRSQGHRCCQR